ncbi:hypothetical protein TSUD_111240 [Trifolium subterraneum]|uniref:Uncharacterized protein n=1 Tax=Trifolium subterraneum TaxID=3900 RepID=A0A2Z6LRW1_TRISU|nr:hypothetical protein TSUD_111240 [Trifolium subterraneum]
MSNSSSMQRGIAPPHGFGVEGGFRSNKKVSMPPLARASAEEDPAGPPPITATLSLRPEIDGRAELEAEIVTDWKRRFGFVVGREIEGKHV